MRRRIVALSFLCFFSSDFLFRFSRLAAIRYSFNLCFRSHSLMSAPFGGIGPRGADAELESIENIENAH